jgi:hypothetical protein
MMPRQYGRQSGFATREEKRQGHDDRFFNTFEFKPCIKIRIVMFSNVQ